MEQKVWAAIQYTLPREPSRARVSVWRKLKKIGAANMQQSLWLLPYSDDSFSLLNKVKNEVLQNGGESFVMTVNVDDDGQKIIVDQFNAARNEEYTEFLEQCTDFFKEIDKEISRKNFTFAEIEENEEELNKLKEWFGKISARDTFNASLGEKAHSTLDECARVLEVFCDKVYEFNEEGNRE